MGGVYKPRPDRRDDEIVIAHPDATRPGGCAHMLGRPATAEQREHFIQDLDDDDPDREKGEP